MTSRIMVDDRDLARVLAALVAQGVGFTVVADESRKDFGTSKRCSRCGVSKQDDGRSRCDKCNEYDKNRVRRIRSEARRSLELPIDVEAATSTDPNQTPKSTDHIGDADKIGWSLEQRGAVDVVREWLEVSGPQGVLVRDLSIILGCDLDSVDRVLPAIKKAFSVFIHGGQETIFNRTA